MERRGTTIRILSITLLVFVSVTLVTKLVDIRSFKANGDDKHLRYMSESKLLSSDLRAMTPSRDGNDAERAERYFKQRIMLSRRLNSVMQTLAKQSCEITDKNVSGHGSVGKRDSKISLNGGWCRKESMENSGHHKTDMKLMKALSKFLAGKSVGSFGDGPGAYKREILKLGQVKSYDAYDGAPYTEETSEGRVKYMDLSVPQYGIPLYDWVLSLEVAEHIPAKSEEDYLDNIVRHAGEGIIISWGTPGQGGTGHVNLRTLQYVIDKMSARGFTKDKKSSDMFEASATFGWFKKRPSWDPTRDEGNIQVFHRNKDNPADVNEA